jgi:hypothetical protein
MADDDINPSVTDCLETITNLRQSLGEARVRMEQMQMLRDEEKLTKVSIDTARTIENYFVGGFRGRADRFAAVQVLIKQLLVKQALGATDWNPRPAPVADD